MWIWLITLIIIFKFRGFFYNLPSFIYWKYIDIKNYDKDYFDEFGFRMFCGRQGSGKTVGMVWLLENLKKRYPKVKIYTNIEYKNQDGKLTSWEDILDPKLRNGTNGVIFCVDEIQNEFSSNAWKDFPESILSEITQQRKQRILILSTSQVFRRVVKALREQCYQVVECKTFAKRWTRLKCYDGEEYDFIIDSKDPKAKFKLPKIWKKSFVQSNELRDLYDTFAKVERMAKVGFIPKNTNT